MKIFIEEIRSGPPVRKRRMNPSPPININSRAFFPTTVKVRGNANKFRVVMVLFPNASVCVEIGKRPA